MESEKVLDNNPNFTRTILDIVGDTLTCAVIKVERDTLANLIKACKQPCYVSIQRLSDDDLKKYNVDLKDCVSNYSHSELCQPSTSYHSLQRIDSLKEQSIFEKFRKKRESYLNKALQRAASTDMNFYGVFSSDEFDSFSSDEYESDDGHGRRKRKRRRLNYEDDLEWSPSSESKVTHSLKQNCTRSRQLSKRLRINPRRKRIESGSSDSDSDYDSAYNVKVYRTRTKDNSKTNSNNDGFLPVEDVYNLPSFDQKIKTSTKKKPPIPSISKPLTDSPADNDVLSKIMQEMEDYHHSKVGKMLNKNSKNELTSTPGDVSSARPGIKALPLTKKRKSHIIKVTDSNLSALRQVKTVIKHMVNSVCSFEEGNDRFKKCKWCDTLYPSCNVKDTICAICKDLKRDGNTTRKKSLKNTLKKKITGSAASHKVGGAKNKMMNKVFKQLPKYEKQRLMYNDKISSATEKKYNHLKSFVVSKDLEDNHHNEINKSEISEHTQVKKKKVKNKMPTSPNRNLIKTQKLNSSAKTMPNLNKGKMKSKWEKSKEKMLEKVRENNKVSVTNIDKGLFLMTFPESNNELEMENIKDTVTLQANKQSKISSDNSQIGYTESKKELEISQKNKLNQSVGNNAQYGTYLLPPVPTVVVANYAAADPKSGDYYLSSLYYQNEMTQSKNAIVGNVPPQNSALSSNSLNLSSMPSLDQLMKDTNNSVHTLSQTYKLNASNTANFETINNISNIPIPNIDLLNQQLSAAPVPNDSPYPYELNVTKFVNTPHLPMEPMLYQSTEIVQDSGIENLFANSQLQIESVPFQNSQSCDDSFQRSRNMEDPPVDQNSTSESTKQDNSDTTLGYSVKESMNNFSEVNSNTNIPTSLVECSNEKGKSYDSNNTSSENKSHWVNQESSSLICGDKESSNPLLQNTAFELDAIGILGVIDLDKNPKNTLYGQIETNKKECEKLESLQTRDEISEQRLVSLKNSKRALYIAHRLLNAYGSFSKFSDSFLKVSEIRSKEIKKEYFEDAHSSCQFASKQSTGEQLFNNESSTCGYSSQAPNPLSHIEKIQSQVNSMQNNSVASYSPPVGVHPFPVPGLSPVSASVATAMTDTLNESRETPSRGSGPRTPARPESAMSQPEEIPLTPAQIKKERQENINSPRSQCAFSDNSSPQLSSALPINPNNYSQNRLPSQIAPTVAEDAVPRITAPPPLVPQTPSSQRFTVFPNVPIPNNSQVQNAMQGQNRGVPPNVTVPFNANSNFSKVLLNIASKHHLPRNATSNVHPNTNVIIKNGQVYNVQQVYLPNPSGLQQRLNAQSTASSMNMNQFIFEQSPMTATSSVGGTMIVNSGSRQGMYPVQNRNVNTPGIVNTPQQSSQMYNPGPPLQRQIIQQISSPTPNQASPSAGYLMPQSNQVLFFEIQRSR